jgi:transposase
MKIYVGIDLHSNNSFIAMIDEENKAVYKKRLANDLAVLLEALKPYKNSIEGVVVESTYNWYWLADGLQEAGYKVHLANVAANIQYSGIKNTGDESDALWLANLLRLNILSTGHIYPKEKRGIRELLRKRLILVRQQTACLLSIQGGVTRYENIRIASSKIKSSSDDKNNNKVLNFIKDENVKFAVQSQLKVLDCIIEQINLLEKQIQKIIKPDPNFALLKSMPGVGPILAMTILLETGDIKRFKSAGNYSSYCRCVESKRISNEKKKGINNRKNGNAYLCWAFIEASNCAIANYPEVKKYYQRKLSKVKLRVVAIKTIANKLTKACYFMLRDNMEFDMKKIFL